MILLIATLQLHNAKDHILRVLGLSTAEQVGKQCLEACLDATVIALALVSDAIYIV